LKEVLVQFELRDGHVLAITTDNYSSNDLMTRELQSTREASGVEGPKSGHLIPYIAHVIRLALHVLMSHLSVRGCSNSWEAHEHDQKFGENESIDIGKSQRLQKRAMLESTRCRP